MCVSVHTCALKYGDGRYQANERGEERKTCRSLQTAQETQGSFSAPVSSTLESGSGRGQAGGQCVVALQRSAHAAGLAPSGQRLWAQGGRLLGEMCPRAPQCSCLLILANTK